MTADKKMVLYAPNVHTGGGFVLLQALLAAWPEEWTLCALLDERARGRLKLPVCGEWHWFRPTLGSRTKAERMLHSLTMRNDTVLCFHGLPPLLRNVGRVLVFQQNRLYFGLTPLRGFSIRTAVRLAVERLVSRLFRGRVAQYIVQTPSMALDLSKWYMSGNPLSRPVVCVLPFVNPLPLGTGTERSATEWDFVYVADGEAHKNHRQLLAAWRELALQGIRPRLALTLSARDIALMQAVDTIRSECGAEVYNLGQMTHAEVIDLYRRSRALIFPSLSESFGLPLIEAQQLGLPIVAAELDYVRDVCDPVQTFDPCSPQSIAKAVKRFLGHADKTVTLRTPAEFWQILLGESQETKYPTGFVDLTTRTADL